MKNTKHRGEFRFMLYPSGRGKYTAVCLELGLVREGTNPMKLRQRISVLARKYKEGVIKHQLDDSVLNQTLPKKYLRKYESILTAMNDYKNWKRWQGSFEMLIWKMEEQNRKNFLVTA